MEAGVAQGAAYGVGEEGVAGRDRRDAFHHHEPARVDDELDEHLTGDALAEERIGIRRLDDDRGIGTGGDVDLVSGEEQPVLDLFRELRGRARYRTRLPAALIEPRPDDDGAAGAMTVVGVLQSWTTVSIKKPTSFSLNMMLTFLITVLIEPGS